MIYYELPTNSFYKRWPILVLRKSSQAQIGGCWDDWWNPRSMAHVVSFDVEPWSSAKVFFPETSFTMCAGYQPWCTPFHMFLNCFIMFYSTFLYFAHPRWASNGIKSITMFYFVISSFIFPYSQSWGNARNGKHIMKHDHPKISMGEAMAAMAQVRWPMLAAPFQQGSAMLTWRGQRQQRLKNGDFICQNGGCICQE